MLKIKFIALLLTLIVLFQIFPQDTTLDITNSVESRKDLIKQANAKISELSKGLAEKKKQIAELDKKIKGINDSIIKSLDNDEISGFMKSRNELLLEKIGIEREINDINTELSYQKNELSDLKKNYYTANGTINWNYNYDISDKTKYKPGKWNISVKAIDNNKNESNEEVINIIIDPKSDIPSVNIINPVSKMRVPGNLRIVGTAIDDDAIDKVVLYIDGSEDEKMCNGKDFWFYDLDTTSMTDGVHSLKVKSIDINGIQSKVVNVSFQLDRKKPAIDVSTIKSQQSKK